MNTSAVSSSSTSPLVVPPGEAEAYLAKMNIPVAVIRDAVFAAHQEAVQKADWPFPRTAFGLTRWIETVGNLRRQLIESHPEFWEHREPKGRPVLLSTDGKFHVGVVGANSDTGSDADGAMPQVVRKKGPETESSVNNQMALIPVFSLLSTEAPENPALPPRGSWFLLYNLSEGQIKCELSLPTSMTNGKFDGWRIRVLLEPVELTEKFGFEEGGEDVEFEVNELGS